MKPSFIRKFSYIVLLIGVACGLVDCSVISPSSYDSQCDKLITELQSDTDALLVKLASLADQINSLSGKDDPVSVAEISGAVRAASFQENVASYDKIKIVLDSLKVRVDALGNPNTAKLDDAIQRINNTLFGPESLMSAHESQGYLDTPTLVRFQAILDAEFANLLGIELAG